MNYQEMIEKTGMRIVGICKGVNEYVKPETGRAYYSVDVEIKGTRFPVNVKLPDMFNRSILKAFDLCQLDCIIKPSFDKKGIMLEALPVLAAPASAK